MTFTFTELFPDPSVTIYDYVGISQNNERIVASNTTSLFSSTDGGNTWSSAISFPTTMTVMDMDPTGQYVLLNAGQDAYIYNFTNDIFTKIITSLVQIIDIKFGQNTNVYLTYYDGVNERFIVSTDLGQNWTASPVLFANGCRIAAATKTPYVYVYTKQNIYISADAGLTFSSTTTEQILELITLGCLLTVLANIQELLNMKMIKMKMLKIQLLQVKLIFLL